MPAAMMRTQSLFRPKVLQEQGCLRVVLDMADLSCNLKSRVVALHTSTPARMLKTPQVGHSHAGARGGSHTHACPPARALMPCSGK